jgi:ATP-dependent helicase IRC3
MNLRGYQLRACRAVDEAQRQGLNRVLMTMPTGTGKTVTFAKLIHDAFADGARRAVVLAHREELLDQAKDKIQRVCPDLSVGVEAASRRAGAFDDVVVASVQTIGREGSPRLEALRNADRLIIDEAHHACAGSYQIAMEALGSYDGSCFTVGCTATPKRLDNKPLYGDHDAVFEEEVYRYELRAAIEDGYLCDVRGFRVETNTDLSAVQTRGGDYAQGQLERAVDTEERNRLAIQAWREICSDRKTIVFCTGVGHAHHVAEQFNESGVRAVAIDGTTDKQVRRDILRKFAAGEFQVLCNMEVLTEGFDQPDVSCVLMLRPTQSWGLYCQMVGRGTRVLPGTIDALENHGAEARRAAIRDSAKADCIVLDVVDLTSKHELSSVPALLGMPARLDLQGKTLTETAQALDDLGARAGAIATQAPRTFQDILRLISEVDLLSQTAVPEEIQRASRFAWLQMPDGTHVLDCGPSKDGGGRRTAYLRQDALGHFVLKMMTHYRSGEVPVDAIRPELRVGNTLAQAIRDSDRVLVSHWTGMGTFATRDARWKERPASDKQVAALKKLRIPIEGIPNLTAGQAHGLISRAMAGRGH